MDRNGNPNHLESVGAVALTLLALWAIIQIAARF